MVGCNFENTAGERLLKHFDLQELQKFDVDKVRSKLLMQLPKGSSESEVYQFLKEAKIGADKLSSYYPLKNGRIICRIEFDPETSGAVKESFGIFFIMDEKECLQDIEIKSWITGL